MGDGEMIREWLPHLIVSVLAFLFAISGATYLAMTDEEQEEVERHWQDFVAPFVPHADRSETANQTLEVRMPPRPFVVWSTFAMTGVASFYLAAGLAGFVHRTEESL